jgi:lysophospholipase L1-like esterase
LKNIFLIWIAIFVLAFSSQSVGKGVIIVGDSLSAMEDSWPSYIKGHHIGLMAQGGRTIRDFDIPRDIVAGTPFTTVVYFLGANDAAQGYPTYYAHMRFKSHLQLLKQRHFKVAVIIPPTFTKSPYATENFIKYRRELMSLCTTLELDCYDSMEVWDNDLLEGDGIHPVPELSRKLGCWLQDIIDKM